MMTRTSLSKRPEPIRSSPTFNSSNVIAPLPSASIILKVCLSPAISSSDNLSAINWQNRSFHNANYSDKYFSTSMLSISNEVAVQYTQCYFLHLVHGHKLLHPRQYSRIKRAVWSHPIFTNPRMTCCNHPNDINNAVVNASHQIFSFNKIFLQRTWCAVKRLAGSGLSMFLIKFFELSDICGHGSESKSRTPPSTWSKMPCSVSTSQVQLHQPPQFI